MRWYNFYFRTPDNPGDPFTHSHNETMGIKAKNKEDAIMKFWENIPKGYRSSYEILEIEEGRLEENNMKLTKEDIKKYGMEEEKLFLEALDEYYFTDEDANGRVITAKTGSLDKNKITWSYLITLRKQIHYWLKAVDEAISVYKSRK